jgi:hypothetical protein
MMKRILCILSVLCVLDLAAMAQGSPPLTVQEVDGSPRKTGITKIVVTNGTLSITGNTATITISGGGGGSPGGSTTQVQYNDTGAFAGAAGFTFNGTSTVTLGVAGTSVGAIAFKNATSGTVTLQPVTGALGTVTLSLPAATDTLVGLAATQTLTNKTLTAPVIATISNTGTLTLPTSTDTLVGKATTDTFTNKTLTASSNVLGGVTMTLGSDADGDIYYRSSNVLTRLPKGTALQVLRMNAGATAPEWAAAAGGGGITIGTTTITSGTDTRVLYNNAGVVGEYAITGTGNVAMSASPTLTGTVAAAAATFSGTIVQTSASATAFESGPNGGTNPVFRLVNSTASAATGLSITGNAAGSGVFLTAISSGASEDIWLRSKGSTGSIVFKPGNTASNTFTFVDQNGDLTFRTLGVDNIQLSTLNSAINLASNVTIVWSSTTSQSGSKDVTLRRAAAANFAFGAADAAAPVAQTLSVQNVVGGTSNTAGANWTLAASRGTGTGTGGDFIVQTAPAGGSGTTQNALAAAFTVKGNGAVELKTVTFANLPTVANAYLIYCSDCTIASPCASGGGGALAKGIAGAWVCN